jgi:hypothetical protein
VEHILIVLKITGVDIFFGQGNEDDDDEDSDGNGQEGVQEFEKYRWNLNAPFRDGSPRTRPRPETFDLINSRLLSEGINADRWPAYVRDLKHLLKYGGWLQMVELELRFQSNSGRLRQTDDEPLHRWWRWYDRGMTHINKDVRVGQKLERLMRDAGFEHVQAVAVPLQVGAWNQSK